MKLNTRHLYTLALVIITLLIFTLTCTSIIARERRTDKHRANILIHKYLEDYNTYLATITQGRYGSLFHTNPYITTDHEPKPLFMYYTLIGLFTRPLPIPVFVIYHAARGLTLLLVMSALYYAGWVIFGNRRWATATAALSFLSTIPPDIVFSQTVAQNFLPWWISLSAIGRANALAHHLAAQSFLIFGMFTYIQFVKKKHIKLLVISSIAGTIAVFAVPHTGIMYVGIITLFELIQGVLQLVKTKNLIQTIKDHIHGLIMLLPITGLLIISMSTSNKLWIANREWEVGFWGQDPYALYHLYAAHLLLILPAVGGVWILRKRLLTHFMILLVWILLPLLVFPFLPTLGIGAGRFALQTYILIPLAIMTCIFLQSIWKHTFGRIIVSIYLLLLAGWIPYNIYSFTHNDWQYAAGEPLSTKYYPPQSYYELALWIRDHIPKQSNILVGPELGDLIVSFAPVFVYIGDQTHGSNWDLVIDSHIQFYNESMTENDALSWILEHKIEYVILDATMMWTGKNELPYSFLSLLWRNDDVGIYRVD